MLKTYAALAALAVVALIGGTWYASVMRSGGDPVAACLEPGAIRGSDAFGGPFTLTDHTGRQVTADEIVSEPALIYFGYTFCPDICPMDAARNAAAVDDLAAAGHSVRPVFITVDPARDTVEVLAEYAGFMHPDMIGLTGSEAEVEAAADAYRVAYSRGSGGDEEDYLMNHSAFTYLHLPDRGVVAIFNPALNPQTGGEGVTEETVARVTQCVLERV